MAKTPPNAYTNMEFAPYQYREYPKWMAKDPATKQDIIVKNADEEAAFLEGKKPKKQELDYKIKTELEANPEGFGKNSGNEKEVKEQLLKAALELGINAKKTWGIKKLQDAINAYDNC